MTGVYYNENDPIAAAWLRELVAQKVIPDGEVDTRSIVDVRPADLAGFRQCHFFAGIGGWAYALTLAGWPLDREVWTGSCPCQPFSVAGSGAGADDPRHLWPTWERLILERRPAAIFGEQTASLDGRYWLDLVFACLEAGDYALGAFNLPAACAGAPHRRQRLWFVADDNRQGRDRVEAARLHERWAGARGHQPPAGDVDGPPGDDALGRGGARGVVDADGQRGGRIARDEDREKRAAQSGRQNERGGLAEPAHASADGDVGDAEEYRLADRRDAGTSRARRAAETGTTERRAVEPPDSSGDGRTFWDAVDWIPCSDGKARPVEPGSFPLADGVSARVGRLRGYGNAIVPELAAIVVRAYLDLGR